MKEKENKRHSRKSSNLISEDTWHKHTDGWRRHRIISIFYFLFAFSINSRNKNYMYIYALSDGWIDGIGFLFRGSSKEITWKFQNLGVKFLEFSKHELSIEMEACANLKPPLASFIRSKNEYTFPLKQRDQKINIKDYKWCNAYQNHYLYLPINWWQRFFTTQSYKWVDCCISCCQMRQLVKLRKRLFQSQVQIASKERRITCLTRSATISTIWILQNIEDDATTNQNSQLF